MTIHPAAPPDRDALLDVWLRSVRATHTFLTEDDIQSLLPHVRDYLASDASVPGSSARTPGAAVGFVGLTGTKVEALFLRIGADERQVPLDRFHARDQASVVFRASRPRLRPGSE